MNLISYDSNRELTDAEVEDMITDIFDSFKESRNKLEHMLYSLEKKRLPSHKQDRLQELVKDLVELHKEDWKLSCDMLLRIYESNYSSHIRARTYVVFGLIAEAIK